MLTNRILATQLFFPMNTVADQPIYSMLIFLYGVAAGILITVDLKKKKNYYCCTCRKNVDMTQINTRLKFISNIKKNPSGYV